MNNPNLRGDIAQTLAGLGRSKGSDLDSVTDAEETASGSVFRIVAGGRTFAVTVQEVITPKPGRHAPGMFGPWGTEGRQGL